MPLRELTVAMAGDAPAYFCDPLQTFVAYDEASAISALEHIEHALERGYFIAGYIAYELGYAFVGLPRPKRFQVHTQADVRTYDSPADADKFNNPLLVLGVFEQALPIPQMLATSRAAKANNATSDSIRVSELRASSTFAQYADRIKIIAQALHAGDVYQVNYTLPHFFTYCGEPASLFSELHSSTQAPYAAFMEMEGSALLSLSPELFLDLSAHRITTRPMKGTAPLDRLPDLANAKNRAEHVMIVDLLRNDLSRICRDVNVTRLFTTEYYPTFATMTSTITGERRLGTPFLAILEAMFPCGSVTGAPKRSAMSLIGELECYDRGPYCGTIGYLGAGGRGQWNVAIRTLCLDTVQNIGRLDLGGGVVADSTPEGEWREIGLKSKFFDRLRSECATEQGPDAGAELSGAH